MQKLHIPDHEETFMKFEKKDFLSHNRKQINTIDVQKNYYKAQKRGYGNYQPVQHSPMRGPKRALEHVNDPVTNNPRYSKVMGIQSLYSPSQVGL
jgi:hypothetical protein